MNCLGGWSDRTTGAGLGHGRIVRWDPRTGQRRNVTVWPEIYGLAAGVESHRYRFRWTTPLHHSPHAPDTIYAGSNVVHRSTDHGSTWSVVSPDLTRAVPDRLTPSGGPITIDNTGPENHCTLSALKESPRQPGLLWAGSDDGLVHVSQDHAAAWSEVAVAGLPSWSEITSIEPSPHDEHAVYLTASRHKLGEPGPHAFRSTDLGQHWTRITVGLPPADHLHVLREDPLAPGLLYAGSESGAHVSFDHGDRWYPLPGLPVAPVYDLVVVDHALVVATHGRSIWILDDLSPLRQLDAGALDRPIHLFKPAPVPRWRVHDRAFDENESTEDGYVSYKAVGAITVGLRVSRPDGIGRAVRFLDAGANPDVGAIFHYTLRDELSEGAELTMRIRGTSGVTIRQLGRADGLTSRRGLNRFVWDLRTEPPRQLRAPFSMDSPLSQWLGPAAPLVLPGWYTAELAAGGNTVTTELHVLPDPRVETDEAALAAQYSLKKALCDQLSRVHEMLDALWYARERLRLTGRSNGELSGLQTRITRIESALLQQDGPDGRRVPAKLREKITGLLSMIDESDDAPSAGAIGVANRLEALVRQRATEVRQLLATLPDVTTTTPTADRRPSS